MNALLLPGLLNYYFRHLSTEKNLKNKIFYDILIPKIINKPKKRSVESFKAYLNPTKYPSDEGYESTNFQTLSKDLCNAYMSCGFNLVRNGMHNAILQVQLEYNDNKE